MIRSAPPFGQHDPRMTNPNPQPSQTTQHLAFIQPIYGTGLDFDKKTYKIVNFDANWWSIRIILLGTFPFQHPLPTFPLRHHCHVSRWAHTHTTSFHTWNIAECSESAGSIFTLCLCARGSTKGPPAIKVSLFANAMSFPASIAATVG